MERVLAVANEEGIVRLYNTERCENPILKGEFTALPQPITAFIVTVIFLQSWPSVE
jgi:hypothetical protein